MWAGLASPLNGVEQPYSGIRCTWRADLWVEAFWGTLYLIWNSASLPAVTDPPTRTEGDEDVQIVWSVTAIASLFTIIFMLTRW